MKIDCCICKRKRERASCKIITLSPEERVAVQKTGVRPLDEYVYCAPCWRTLSNRATGTALMKGLAQTQLNQLGVPNAEGLAEDYYRKLLAKTERTNN